MVAEPERYDVWLVSLDPSRGAEIRKTRPCVVVSPDEMNRNVRTVIVAPMTSTIRAYPTRVAVTFEGRRGEIALDQMRTVDKARLLRRLGALPTVTVERLCDALIEMFAP